MKLLTSETKQQQLEWRRSQVLELASEGYSQREIASKLQVDAAAVNRDIQFLKQQAQENLQKHIHETIPHEYQKAMTGIDQMLKMCWSIVSKSADEKTRLQALALINDCTKHKVDLSTNGVVITDAIKYVQGQMDHLNKQEKEILQDINKKEEAEAEEERQQEEQQTHNTVF